jgi:hypothetical protein
VGGKTLVGLKIPLRKLSKAQNLAQITTLAYHKKENLQSPVHFAGFNMVDASDGSRLVFM